MDIVVTVPKKEYKKDDDEIKKMKETDLATYEITPLPDISIGNRVFFIREGKVHSSMRIKEIRKNFNANILILNDYKDENIDISIKGFPGYRYKWW